MSTGFVLTKTLLGNNMEIRNSRSRAKHTVFVFFVHRAADVFDLLQVRVFF